MSKATYPKNMIIRLTVFLLLLLNGLNGYADNEEEPVINYTWLANSTNLSGFTRPEKVSIGINAYRQAYYKIADSRNTIIKAGLLNQGSNIIEIGDHSLFKKPHTHIYTLFLKTGERIVKKKIEIDVHIDRPEKIEKTGQKPEDPAGVKKNSENIPEKGEYSLSLFIEDQFILKEDKSHHRQIIIEPPKGMDENYGQPSHIDGSYPALQSSGIPVLPLVKALLKKTVLKKKGKKKKRLPKPRQLTIKFIEKDSRGKEQLIKARLGIKVSDFK